MRKRYSYSIPDPPEAGYQSLANVWIALTFWDLRLALRAKGPAAKARQQECIGFLCSKWTAALTNLELQRLVKLVMEEERRDDMYILMNERTEGGVSDDERKSIENAP